MEFCQAEWEPDSTTIDRLTRATAAAVAPTNKRHVAALATITSRARTRHRSPILEVVQIQDWHWRKSAVDFLRGAIQFALALQW